MNSSKICCDNQKPIIYYQGTFDPAHEGHLSTLRATMEATQADFAVIVVDKADNIMKPERSSWESRRETAIKTFGHIENVSVSDLSKEETKQELLKKNYVIALMGSDVWPLYSERKKIKFDALCVTTRNNEETSYPKSLAGKAVIHLIPPVQGCSSTKIRNYLKAHPELYEKGLIPYNTILDCLSRPTLDYILKNKLYYVSKEEHLEKIKQGIKKYISEHLFKDKEFELVCLTTAPPNDVKFGGQSGDLTFLASCKEEKIFIKAYARPSHLQDCKNERSGIAFLDRLSLNWAKALSPVDYEKNNSAYSHVGMRYLDKPDLAKIFKTLNNEESEKMFIEMCFFVGRALSELHQTRSNPIQQDKLIQETDVFNKRTYARIKTLSEEKQQEFSSIFSSSYEDFIKNPGVHTYVHGDANPSNFIVDHQKGVVYFLDLESFFIKRSENDFPLGLPSEDYHRFLNSLLWLNEDGLVPSSVVTSAQEAFKKGYNVYPSSITPEAHRYFSNYWRIRNYKFQKQDPI